MNLNAIELLRENPDKINWGWLSGNPNAIELLREKPYKIYWDWLSINPNKINWSMLSQNPNGIELLRENLDKNMSILTYDYAAMKQTTSLFKEELIAKVFHPMRFERYLTNYCFDMSEL